MTKADDLMYESIKNIKEHKAPYIIFYMRGF